MSRKAIRPLSKFAPVRKRSIHLPGSKSITNRALILAALCQMPSSLSNILLSDDTETCMSALENLHTTKNINCRDAGTVARFLLPVCAALGGVYHFDGSERMRERPMGVLIDILQQQGVMFEFLDGQNRMPFRMKSHGLVGGEIQVDVTDSSQFLSGLLIAAPLAKNGMKIRSSEALAKKPYVQMTLQLMQKFSVSAEILDAYTVSLPYGTYQATTLAIEPDASTASYFFAAAVLCESSIIIHDLNECSLQGDLRFLELLEKMGCQIKKTDTFIEVIGPRDLQGVGEVNMSGFTDTFMTLAVLAPFLPIPTTICGLRHTRLQESDRVAAIVEGLKRVGIQTKDTEDTLTIYPGIPHAATINSHRDHRIAMSFAIMGLKVPGIIIEGAECVSKTCPTFFQLLKEFGD